MKHFEAGVLADFARGLLSENDARVIRTHLSGGCAQCGPAAQFFGKFAKVSTRVKNEAVPDNVLRVARAIVPPRWSAPRRVARIKATLVFDSLVAPAPVGLRSEWHVGWQGLYRA